MTYRYTIGGAAFLTDEPLPDLATNSPTDIEFTAIFADVDEFRVAVDTGALPVVGPGNLAGALDVHDRRCRILVKDPTPGDMAWHLRQLAPIFSSVLGKLVLHASSVMIGDQVAAFVSGSGTGKSTLAQYLTDRGHEAISDDLLPVRFTPHPATLTMSGTAPIGAVYFLHRESRNDASIEPLDPQETLTEHMANGFGEHLHTDTWAMQFDAYHRLAEATSHFSLTIPDDIDALPSVANAIETSLPSRRSEAP